MFWGLGFHIEIKREIFNNIFVPNRKGYSFHIWHVASSSGPLPKYIKLWPWSGNKSCVVGCLGFHIEIKKEIFENLPVPN